MLEAERIFEDRVYEGLRESWAQRHDEWGEERFRAFVRRCIERARRAGFTTERALYRWVNLARLMGEDFDENPDIPWIGAILRQRLRPRMKMELLVQRVRSEMVRRAGAPSEHPHREQ